MLTRGPMAFAMADMTTWRPVDEKFWSFYQRERIVSDFLHKSGLNQPLLVDNGNPV